MRKRVAERLKEPLLRFARSQEGVAGLLFALAAIPAFALAGGVIDYVTIQNEEAKLQNAADAAVLAAMKAGVTTDSEAKQIIIDYLESNYKGSPRVTVNFQNISLTIQKSNNVPTSIHVEIPAKVRTTFWGLVGVQQASLKVISEATQGSGGVEVVMVLDTTGSMGMGTGKLQELKTAAAELVDDLHEMATNSQMSVVKLGLVPYTFAVNVGTDNANAPWLNMRDCCNGYGWDGWVGSRPIPMDITDDSYDILGVPGIPSVYVSEYGDINGPYDNLRPIVPLLDMRDASSVNTIKTELQNMVADGATYIPAGLVWGWRVLSPEEPFTGAMSFADAQQNNVQKVVILMTDGSNTCHNPGRPLRGIANVKECGYSTEIVSDANDRMRRLCQAMHNQGILIVSIAYEVTDNTGAAQEIQQLMQECGNFGYYTPGQGQLSDVFKSIAKKLSRLHLTR